MSSKYYWPSSALTREDMAALHHARTIKKQAINRLIAEAVRQYTNTVNAEGDKEHE